MSHSSKYLSQVAEIASQLSSDAMEQLADALLALRERNGRLFFLGVGGSAANCSHAVNDFRKLVGIESYSPCDNVAELTARINDEGWETAFSTWLAASRATSNDAIFVMSVGGGNLARNVSVNLIRAIDEAKQRGMKVFGIVGRDGGYTKQFGDEVIVIPTVDERHVTPLSEAYQAVVWHGLVSHPRLQSHSTKW